MDFLGHLLATGDFAWWVWVGYPLLGQVGRVGLVGQVDHPLALAVAVVVVVAVGA